MILDAKDPQRRQYLIQALLEGDTETMRVLSQEDDVWVISKPIDLFALFSQKDPDNVKPHIIVGEAREALENFGRLLEKREAER